MFHLVLIWVATLAGAALGFPHMGIGDPALDYDWSTGDPFDDHYGLWSVNYRNGLISSGMAGIRASWPFNAQGTVLSGDIPGAYAYNPTVLPSNSVIRPYPWSSRGYDYGTDAVSVFTAPSSYRGNYYNNLRFGGLRGGWSDYMWAADRYAPSTMGYGTARTSSLRLGGDQMYLKK